jgi:hypothetical protein
MPPSLMRRSSTAPTSPRTSTQGLQAHSVTFAWAATSS